MNRIFLCAGIVFILGCSLLPSAPLTVPILRVNPITTNTPSGTTNMVRAIAAGGGGLASGVSSVNGETGSVSVTAAKIGALTNRTSSVRFGTGQFDQKLTVLGTGLEVGGPEAFSVDILGNVTATSLLVPDGQSSLPMPPPLASAEFMTDIPASQLTGMVPQGNMGSGPANATTFLRGDGSWVPVTEGAATNVVYPGPGYGTATRTNGLTIALDVVGPLTNNTTGNAATATHATTADSATTAGTATSATTAGSVTGVSPFGLQADRGMSWGAGPTLAIDFATDLDAGLLSAADWITFNSKAALGDVTASTNATWLTSKPTSAALAAATNASWITGKAENSVTNAFMTQVGTTNTVRALMSTNTVTSTQIVGTITNNTSGSAGSIAGSSNSVLHLLDGTGTVTAGGYGTDGRIFALSFAGKADGLTNAAGERVLFLSDTNGLGGGGISAATGTNIAAYQAFLATNNFVAGTSGALTNNETRSVNLLGESNYIANAALGSYSNSWLKLRDEAGDVWLDASNRVTEIRGAITATNLAYQWTNAALKAAMDATNGGPVKLSYESIKPQVVSEPANAILGITADSKYTVTSLTPSLIGGASSAELAAATNTTGTIGALVTNAAVSTGDIAGTNIVVRRDALGTDPKPGIVLTNGTAAVAGAQQYSPAIVLGGQGWKTTDPSASQPVSWRIHNQPTQGSITPGTRLYFSRSLNDGAFSSVLYLDGNGVVGGLAAIQINANSVLGSSSNGKFELKNSTYTGFTTLTLGPDSATWPALTASTNPIISLTLNGRMVATNGFEGDGSMLTNIPPAAIASSPWATNTLAGITNALGYIPGTNGVAGDVSSTNAYRLISLGSNGWINVPDADGVDYFGTSNRLTTIRGDVDVTNIISSTVKFANEVQAQVFTGNLSGTATMSDNVTSQVTNAIAGAATNGLHAAAFTGQAATVVAGITNKWQDDAQSIADASALSATNATWISGLPQSVIDSTNGTAVKLAYEAILPQTVAQPAAAILGIDAANKFTITSVTPGLIGGASTAELASATNNTTLSANGVAMVSDLYQTATNAQSGTTFALGVTTEYLAEGNLTFDAITAPTANKVTSGVFYCTASGADRTIGWPVSWKPVPLGDYTTSAVVTNGSTATFMVSVMSGRWTNIYIVK